MKTIFPRAVAAALAFSCSAALAQDAPKPVPGLETVNHIIVIYLENRSFDNLYGLFPGANGIKDAGAAATQVDKNGVPYEKLPPVLNTNLKPAIPDARFPADLPNAPFRAEPYAGLDQTTGDAVHRFYQEQLQIDGGKMDKFVAWTNAGALVMSYYDGAQLPLWEYAKTYVLMDNFFHAAFGGSFINHLFLVCACTAVYKDAPKEFVAELDEKGALVKDGVVTPDGYIVNNAYPVNGPRKASGHALLAPVQEMPHIGDRLDEAGVSWAWYAGGWDDAVAGKPDPLFQFHHQPFAVFKDTALGTEGAKAHLKDETDLIAGVNRGKLPQVVFFKPIGEDNEHPGYTNVLAGENRARVLIRMIEKSELWKDSLIIVTYDENGGLWDHVAPPKGDRWGPGARVPALVIGPMARKGFVDRTQYDTTSILKLIETRFGLKPLGERDAAAADMTAALDLAAQGK
ncbi:MAG: alkaline phosphatase family protein [Rhodomicrobium sp.]